MNLKKSHRNDILKKQDVIRIRIFVHSYDQTNEFKMEEAISKIESKMDKFCDIFSPMEF